MCVVELGSATGDEITLELRAKKLRIETRVYRRRDASRALELYGPTTDGRALCYKYGSTYRSYDVTKSAIEDPCRVEDSKECREENRLYCAVAVKAACGGSFSGIVHYNPPPSLAIASVGNMPPHVCTHPHSLAIASEGNMNPPPCIYPGIVHYNPPPSLAIASVGNMPPHSEEPEEPAEPESGKLWESPPPSETGELEEPEPGKSGELPSQSLQWESSKLPSCEELRVPTPGEPELEPPTSWQLQ
ncbi:hypothetical protein FIBSPDRAFT_898330 [Athelia psychrophila]|uniref:Uncharacterized protein n=1 Tax=Athelia psychrophila TaxID=1759441 RepID=A0A166B2Z7_9AGAM|nr:hypothetical protein FIBSPDRAFT_898330 [Fibularhizoctonia sp. CBS 109695]